jgi:3-phosphoshikimate 1-carboxyvinyltransferase
MASHICINQITNLKEVYIHLPASKSICNRVQIIRALSKSNFVINNFSTATDCAVLQNILSNNYDIKNCNDAGTAFRFATAYYAMQPGNHIITGSTRLTQRPIATLVQALQQLGVNISYNNTSGYAPFTITGTTIINNTVSLSANESSQFASALCLIAPYAQNGLQITLTTSIASLPYIKLTLQLMHWYGVQSTFVNNVITIAPARYLAKDITIENDWSAATFFYALLMLLPSGTLHLSGLYTGSMQGDSAIINIAKNFGVQTIFNKDGIIINKNTAINPKPFTLDLLPNPDLAIPLIVACALQYPQVSITGLHTLIHKESNRIQALQTELAKIGLILNYHNDILTFGGQLIKNATPDFNTYKDHRIAMALSLTSVYLNNITINDANVVNKSFPNYWQEFKKITTLQ